MSQEFYQLTISEVVRETPSAVSLRFDIPAQYREKFRYEAGQYLTLKLNINGEDIRRSYSISSAVEGEPLQVSVKEVDGGKASTFLTKGVRKGDRIEVSGPEGKFTINWDPQVGRAYYFIAAGSGITPIMSMLKTGLEKEPRSAFYLLYGNRLEEDVMFADQLREMEKKYSGQFRVIHTFSGLKKGLIKRLFSAGDDGSKWKGRIDNKKLTAFMDECPARDMEAHFYICGPGDMISKSEKKLISLGVSSDCIHKEYFTAGGDSQADASHFTESKVTAHLDGQTYEVTVPKGKTVLDVLIEAGADPPYSCTSGVCSTCAAKISKGKVEMDTCLALDDSEIADGIVLTCQSHPVTEEVELNYEF